MNILSAREVKLHRENADHATKVLSAELDEQVKRLEAQGQREQATKLRDKMEDDITRLGNLAYFDALDYYLPYLYPQAICALDYLPPDGLVVIDEPHQAKSHWEQIEAEMVERLLNRANRGALLATQKLYHLGFDSAMHRIMRDWRVLSFALMPRQTAWLKTDEHIPIEAPPMDPFGGQMQMLADQVKTWIGNGLSVVIASAQDHRVTELFGEFETPAFPAESLGEGKPGLYVVELQAEIGFQAAGCRTDGADGLRSVRDHQDARPRRAAREGVPDNHAARSERGRLRRAHLARDRIVSRPCQHECGGQRARVSADPVCGR